MDDDSWLTFPDEPRVELDRVLGELVDRARDVITTQGRLRALLRANLAVVQQLDLPVVLQRIVDAAVELLGAQYAALGVIAPHGGLEQFIHSGMSPDDVARIGHLPEGHGLLGALIDDPRPIRLRHTTDDPRSAGFPAEHPPMDSFLGVPVRVRNEVYGNLYVSNRATGEFSAEDEQLAIALAATAGFAIDNARLFAETRSRQAWSAASAEIASALLSADRDDSLAILADRVSALSGADLACILLPADDPELLVVSVVTGIDGIVSRGDRISREHSTAGSVLEARAPRILDGGVTGGGFGSNLLGPVLVVPLLASESPLGVLIVGRSTGGTPFTAVELDMIADFAGHASIAMELASARADRQRILLLEDRARIARDLHDHVIQRLFATGLGLQTIAAALGPGPTAERLELSIDNVDAAIAEIRTAIFAIAGTRSGSADTVRHSIIDIVNELGGAFASLPRIGFTGPVDLVISDRLADDVIAVVRESLTNVARHAHAQHVSVSVTVEGDLVTVEVGDDGVGIPASVHRSGLSNLEHRASRYGGALQIETSADGTRVTWSVPYRQTLEAGT